MTRAWSRAAAWASGAGEAGGVFGQVLGHDDGKIGRGKEERLVAEEAGAVGQTALDGGDGRAQEMRYVLRCSRHTMP